MSDDAYEDILNRAVPQALKTVPQILAERCAAPERLNELLALPSPEREAILATAPQCQTYSLASYALERSEKAVSCDPGLALEMTRLARTISTRVNPQSCGGTQAIADLGAYALATEGNVQRVCGDMALALAAFGRSRELLKQGGIDPDLLARIDLMEASLRRDLRQCDVALALLDRAADVFFSLGERRRWIQAQINRANVFLVMKEFDEATVTLNGLGEPDDPQMALCIRHNQASALAFAGKSHEADRLLEETRALYLHFPDPLITNRRRWLEGIIAGGLGQGERARSLLQEAGTDLDERGYVFDAALVRLDLRKLQARRRAEPVC
jgi:tetratricopeptide (TPR) repeat protein